MRVSSPIRHAAGSLLLAALAALPGVVPAQSSPAGRALATRAELEQLSQRLERGGGRDRTGTAELIEVRARLAEGDFRPGDRLLIEVQGEEALTDTFTVDMGRELMLPPPAVGTLSLAGVLRSEAQDTVAAFVARFVQNPVVRVTPLLRVMVEGEVGRAGFYEVPATAVLGQVMMAAGGATARADMKKLRIDRNGKPLLKGDQLEQAFRENWTLDRASLRDGDRLVVGGRGGTMDQLRFTAIVVSIATGLFAISRAF